jgi:hypothetical protein
MTTPKLNADDTITIDICCGAASDRKRILRFIGSPSETPYNPVHDAETIYNALRSSLPSSTWFVLLDRMRKDIMP